jgi:hypothetical protein
VGEVELERETGGRQHQLHHPLATHQEDRNPAWKTSNYGKSQGFENLRVSKAQRSMCEERTRARGLKVEGLNEGGLS